MTRRTCDEIHIFDSVAERTGNVVEVSGKGRSRACTSMRDLLRRYKVFGDGLFYLSVGCWPEGEAKVTLENEKWAGIDGVG